MEGFTTWAGDARIKTLVMLVLALLALALLTYTYQTYKLAQTPTSANTVVVTGKGEVTAVPDIATFSFGVEAKGAQPQDAQKQSATAMNTIMGYLAEAGIDEKDIKTSDYSLYPEYRYDVATQCVREYCPPGKQVLDGYRVSQMVTVKVRETDNAGDLIANIGSRGATNMSGLSFTIDDDEKLLREAREKAIKNAREHAEELAGDLGVRLGRLVSFEEQGMGDGRMMFAKAEMQSNVALDAAGAPSIPVGENTIVSNVVLKYEIR
jgi:uncharacterized protein